MTITIDCLSCDQKAPVNIVAMNAYIFSLDRGFSVPNITHFFNNNKKKKQVSLK